MGDRVTQIFVETSQAKEPAMDRTTQLFVEMSMRKNPAMERTTQIYIEFSRSLADLPPFKPKTMSF